MTITLSSKLLATSVLLGASAILSMATAAIAQTETYSPADLQSDLYADPAILPAQISNEFQGFQFTTTPYANAQTISILDKDKSNTGFRTVEDEANADAPRSESTGSSFTFKFGLDDRGSESTEE